MWENLDLGTIQDIIKFTGEINDKISGKADEKQSEPEEEDPIDYDDPNIQAQLDMVKSKLNLDYF